ncbi:cytochrome c oxidase, cbb3-type, CcoQ subunit [Helicobacter mustelae]|uniref:Putative cytochrome c oxidase subunit Q, CcoQ n=1 Tax=Helicobacter mustelae (strain ATCC 43772 / CCUG 25715 / CIP 103759 / LMG 18044 / NCTC 12198 / R85-136P) TaxID=679897 RepID=D3UIR9_HELM1|nr:cytochrome c oxidase, cbb3-type, CcoQ subunit [Helicobacter mustelae]CBG40394.1 putative cytochrome c oxidase subunit Q, CcoQ [Helicobacter mustelae 12198]SQH71894.1 cytochrome c oxidase subunit Q, CcoQ [Helicobacter mustelae]STP13034.1 cytochrome c oxidase subunit Q, CcoQ [Helicobacter mustelae]
MNDTEMWRGISYVVITIFLVIFLYGYIISMYRKQKNGSRDYEKYADLALKDRLDDQVIEERIK